MEINSEWIDSVLVTILLIVTIMAWTSGRFIHNKYYVVSECMNDVWYKEVNQSEWKTIQNKKGAIVRENIPKESYVNTSTLNLSNGDTNVR